MKKSVHLLLGILVLSLISLGFISATDITLSKSSYYTSETLQAEIPDVFIDNLQLSNLGIYKSGSVHASPASSGLIKDENRYLYYAVLPDTAGDYYLQISNVRYYQNNQQKTDPIIKNFTIASTNESYLSFNPGAISTSSGFQISIKAYNEAQQVAVDFQPSGFHKAFSLGYGSEKIVYIPISGIANFTKSEIKINSYTIQAIIAPEAASIQNETSETVIIAEPLEGLVALDVKYINATLLPGKNYFKITLVNKDDEVRAINLSTSGEEITASPDYIDELSKEETINITINSDESFEGWINITAEGANGFILVPVNIIITEKKENISYNVAPENLGKTCSQQNGKKCNYDAGEKCTGSETQASDGWCCIGECKTESKSSAWIWGVLILIILAAAGWFLYQKSQQGQAGEKFKNLFQKKAESYEKRLSPEIKPPIEVKKSLTND